MQWAFATSELLHGSEHKVTPAAVVWFGLLAEACRANTSDPLNGPPALWLIVSF